MVGERGRNPLTHPLTPIRINGRPKDSNSGSKKLTSRLKSRGRVRLSLRHQCALRRPASQDVRDHTYSLHTYHGTDTPVIYTLGSSLLLLLDPIRSIHKRRIPHAAYTRRCFTAEVGLPAACGGRDRRRRETGVALSVHAMR